MISGSDINSLIYTRPLSNGDDIGFLTEALVSKEHYGSNSTSVTVKRKKRSAEAANRHRKRYLEILRRKEQLEANKPLSNHTYSEVVGNQLYLSDSQKKNLICKYYYRYASCIHGDNCAFSHDCTPLTSKNLKLCKFFLQGEGKCSKSAEECCYSHDPSLFLCRSNVINGTCMNIGRCKFKHLSQSNIDALDEAEKLRFCYNNKQFLLNLKNNMDTDKELNFPWYIRCVIQLDKRDMRTNSI
ncbi:hypothetical protein BMR1_02g03640 [Babesia microti strain RI]|uniref:C3H1-type domain-containing protein n=1 Tax=Babesia microti (strain RI) TaxID=1133968 RepID=I7I8Y1_BABMR|nr:hypothetical protein BMR1_02g03640 [Babesia microti strain RI]CCF73878.1 hypothetical protein BMR1_02g03640 [Babesia microti strain RI]|eukprot:XP_012648487.1 hypothetical protein BMR1_02g03640 [Babesia microti strain RI]